MRITEKDIENSCYGYVDGYILSKLNGRILKQFNKKKLNYLNLKQHLNNTFSYEQYLVISDVGTNWTSCRTIDNWDLDYVRDLIKSSLHYSYYDCIKIFSNELSVAIKAGYYDTGKYLIRNEVELANFSKSDEFLETFNQNKMLYADDFMEININSKNPKIVHINSPEFKECAINWVLNLMTDLFPEQMMPENNKVEFTS